MPRNSFGASLRQPSAHARKLIEKDKKELYLRVVSLWEMAITVSIRKLKVPLPFTRLVRQHIAGNAIDLLHIEPEHLDVQRKMPFRHRDPLDRLIIAYATAEEMTVVGRDDALAEYSARLDW
jgi:PIN domain nuclease of toxin-antitoxin system